MHQTPKINKFLRRNGTKILPVIAVSIILFFAANTKLPDTETLHMLGYMLPIWSILPFVGILLSIAFIPHVNHHFWERHRLSIAIMWALIYIIPFAIFFGAAEAVFMFLEVILLEYLPFLILLWGLFTVSGGIVIKGNLAGTPKGNLLILVIGTAIASWIGTTGASMLLIRPLLKANKWRENKVHSVMFFIFLVSNMGGCLTPIGDPPLFLGFLEGIPFFWPMKLLPMMLFNAVILLTLYFIIDSRSYKNEIAAGNKPIAKDFSTHTKIEGSYNFIYLAMIIGSVILSGGLASNPAFLDESGKVLKGVHVYAGLVLPYTSIIQMTITIIAGILSLRTTKKELYEANHFTWGPIKEVAELFFGIFVAMSPALAILHIRGAELGLTEPWQFFWATGSLSLFLDNAPTFMILLSLASSLGATTGVETALGIVADNILIAISIGTIFFGAVTYIANAPNFMVRSISIENKVKMPSFLGYMGKALIILFPLFFLDMIVFL